MPIIIQETEKVIREILDEITNDASDKYKTENFLINKLNNQTLLNDKCAICLATQTERESVSNVIITPCGHSLCQDCWSGYLTTTGIRSCPLCRGITSDSVTPWGCKLCNYPNFEERLKHVGEYVETMLDEMLL